jgi:hypothetical protein
MTRSEVVSFCEQYLSNNQVLKALNLILRYLRDKESYLEPQISELKNKFINFEDDNINNRNSNYRTELDKFKAKIRLYLQDLPEFQSLPANTLDNSGEKGSNEAGRSPDNIWAFIWKIITNPKAISITLGLILLAFIIIKLTGRDPFCLIFKDCTPATDTVHIISSKTWAENASLKAKKPYAILSIIQHIIYEDGVENGQKIRKALYRNTYTLRALQDIDLKDDVFLEQYISSGGQDLVEQWAGSELQVV